MCRELGWIELEMSTLKSPGEQNLTTLMDQGMSQVIHHTKSVYSFEYMFFYTF